MTDQQKQIYNCYLKHSRNGQAWKARKDFSDIPDETKNLLIRISQFLNKFSHIKWDDFFGAPLYLHPDEKYPPLKFFITRAAIKIYNLYNKQLENLSPENQLDKIKDGLHFIASFCIENKIKLENYLEFKKDSMPVWTEHYRHHLINPYCLMELGDLNIGGMEEDERELWIPGLTQNFSSFKYRYHQSPKAKTLIKAATTKLKSLIDQTLNFPQN
jgi:hypothetical protein